MKHQHQSQGPTSRGDAVKAAAAGLLATVAGVSAAGAATVPEALPACPTEGNCVSSTSFKLVRNTVLLLLSLLFFCCVWH